VLLPGGHFDADSGEGFAISSSAARDWFVEHLQPGAVGAPSPAVAATS
jgi:uncharacterized protein